MPLANVDAKVAQVAQLVEQRIENPRVTGSIPVLGTTFNLKENETRARSGGAIRDDNHQMR